MSRQPLVVVCQESPVPTNHGGRIDVWRRLTALKRRGVPVHLVCWSETPGDAGQLARLRSVCDSVHVFGYQRGWLAQLRKVILAPVFPAPVLSRGLNSAQMQALVDQLSAQRPCAVMQDGLMGGCVARELASALGVKFVVRSHNIEHNYWRQQLTLAKSVSGKLKILGRLAALRRFEVGQLKSAHAVFDISADDMLHWQALGVRSVVCMPPIAVDADEPLAPEAQPTPRAAEYDVAFVGNLRMPNNVDGICWFHEHVWPRVQQQFQRPLKCLIAGSGPADPRVMALAKNQGITLVVNFESLPQVLNSARTFINPMRSGSGVALKSVDMLKTGKVLVSTTQGVMGLPPEIKGLAKVHDMPDDFARALAIGIQQAPVSVQQASKVLDVFGDDAIVPLLKVIDAPV